MTTHWRDDAACLEIGGDLFYPVGESESTYADLDRALRTCRVACPIRRECLTAAMHEEDGDHWRKRFGIRGGYLPKQRAAMDRVTWGEKAC